MNREFDSTGKTAEKQYSGVPVGWQSLQAEWSRSGKHRVEEKTVGGR
jgi:hypothetical protein